MCIRDRLSRPIDKEFNVEVEGGRFSPEFLNDLVDTHVNKIAPRYVKFQKLYEGKHKIQNRPRKDKNKPNNKLVNDFFGQTIDNTVGYFLGNPIVLNYTEPKKDKAPVEADPADVGVDLTAVSYTHLDVYKRQGLDRVPYIVRDDLTPEQVKAYRIADNKLAELSNWDDELLKKELFELQAVDYSLEVMGFTEIDLKEIFTEKEVPKEKKKKEEKTTLPMLRFGSNSVRITEDELVMLSNRYNEYVESTPDEGFITWLLKRGL